jgi:hypothetical protein
MNATRVGIVSLPTNGRLTRSVPRGASCLVRLGELKLGRFDF